MRLVTPEELRRCDGREGRPCYVAYRGAVYDVSASYHWRNGDHWSLHSGGRDLTEEMPDAPHFDDLLTHFPVVGTCGGES